MSGANTPIRNLTAATFTVSSTASTVISTSTVIVTSPESSTPSVGTLPPRRYDDEQFRLRVRDDGKGIDPAVLATQGLEGQYGLRGMPERAALIGGTLAVWSEAGAGTEVELRLPASIGYATSPRRAWWSRLFAPKTPAHIRGDTL